jgi:transcriptional regulator with XRE-family HTH domain
MVLALSPQQLRSARQSAGLTQEELARAVDVTLRTITRAEAGEGELRAITLARLARVLRQPMESFFVCGLDGEAACGDAHPPDGGAPNDEQEAA